MMIILIFIYDHSHFKSSDVWEIFDMFIVTKNMFGKKCVVASCRDVTGMMMLRFGGNQSQTARPFYLFSFQAFELL